MNESVGIALIVLTICPIMVFLWARVTIRLARYAAARFRRHSDLLKREANLKAAFLHFILALWALILIFGVLAIFQQQ
jgi:hypothetical protein